MQWWDSGTKKKIWWKKTICFFLIFILLLGNPKDFGNEANLDNYDAELCSTTLFSMGEKLLTYLNITKKDRPLSYDSFREKI